MSNPRILIITTACVVLAACSNYDGREKVLVAPPIPPMTLTQPPMAPVDVSGTWFSRIENNAVNCNAGEYVDGKSIVVSQDETEISLLTSAGDQFVGTVNGDIVEWGGSYPERNGLSDFTSTSLVFSTDSASGNAAWTWTDGVDSCNGTMAIGFTLDVTIESDRNSRPNIADQFEFEDDVAFFTGSLGEGIDTIDYFSFTADSDAVIQAELSHFDTASSNLDLQILDEALQVIARSESIDSFEMADAPVTAGVRYFVRIEATSIAGPDTYYLALDIN